MAYDPFSQYTPTSTSGKDPYTDNFGRTYNYQTGQWQSPQTQSTGWKPETRQGLMESGSDFSTYQDQLKGLLIDPSKIQQTPAYQFTKQQGEEAINRSAASRGMLGSGNVLAELAKYGQGLASQEYGGQVNRLSDLMRGSQQFGVSSGLFRPTTYGKPVSSNYTSFV